MKHMKSIGIMAFAFSIIMSPFSLISSEALKEKLPEMQAKPIWVSPNIDGELEEVIWGNAACAENFCLYENKKPVSEKTKAYLLYYQNVLYVAFVCYDSKITDLKITDDIFSGDDVELFLDPGQCYEYTHIAVNPAGKLSFAWNRKNEAKVAVKKFSDRWQVEMAIPFSDIKMPEPEKMKDVWGINFCRSMPRLKEQSCWSPTLIGFHNPSRFGILKGFKDIDFKEIYQKQQNASQSLGGQAFNLRLDKHFYDTNKINLNIRIGEIDSLAGKHIRLSILDKNGDIKIQKDLKSVLLTNKDSIDIASLPQGDYTLKAEMMENGKALFSSDKYFAKIPPFSKPPNCPEIKNGVMYINGKPELPIAIYFGAHWEKYKNLSLKDIDDIADKGFNVLCPVWPFYKEELKDCASILWGKKLSNDGKCRLRISKECGIGIKEVLEEASKKNLRVIGWLPFIWDREKLSDERIMAGGKIILKYRNDPAILCWKSHDETDGWIDLNRETYNMYKNLDPYRPVYLNLINAVPSNKDNADILSTDPYPIGKALITKVSVHVDILRKVLGERPDQSYWVVLQIFGSPVEKWPRCPTPQEERCMTFLALNHGAKGLSYFAYNPEITRKEGGHKFLSEELWQSMKELNRQTKQMSLPYLIGKKISGVSSDRNEIDLAAIEYKGVVYIIACNTIDSQVNAEIKLPSGKKPEKADVEFEERDVPVENGFIKDAFSPYAVHIYKYENR